MHYLCRIKITAETHSSKQFQNCNSDMSKLQNMVPNHTCTLKISMVIFSTKYLDTSNNRSIFLNDRKKKTILISVSSETSFTKEMLIDNVKGLNF